MKPIILKKPVVTEKSMDIMKDTIYTFEVYPFTTKNQIREQVQKQFKVHVIEISTFVRKGKTKSIGKTRKQIIKQAKKFARVRLKPGETIDVFAVTAESSGKK